MKTNESILLKNEEDKNFDDNEIKEDYIKNIPNNLSTPFDYFSLIFYEELNETITKNTNKYIDYRKKSFTDENNEEEGEDGDDLDDDSKDSQVGLQRYRKLDKQEIIYFIVEKILMSLDRKPSYKDHFTKNPLFPSIIPETMNKYT